MTYYWTVNKKFNGEISLIPGLSKLQQEIKQRTCTNLFSEEQLIQTPKLNEGKEYFFKGKNIKGNLSHKHNNIKLNSAIYNMYYT
jgi:hypothetical protein